MIGSVKWFQEFVTILLMLKSIKESKVTYKTEKYYLKYSNTLLALTQRTLQTLYKGGRVSLDYYSVDMPFFFPMIPIERARAQKRRTSSL